MLSNWEWQAKKTKDLLIGGTRQRFLCLPSALWYSMQSFQWLCLIFFLSNLPLSQGYEALHGIPSLKKTQDHCITLCMTAFFSSQLALPTSCFHVPPFFPIGTPCLERTFQNSSVTYNLAHPLFPFKHSSSASACSLHCWNTVIKGDCLSLSFNGWLCPGRQSGRCGRYLCSTERQAHVHSFLLILISHKEKPLYSTMTISWIYTANGRIAVPAACWMETSNHSPGHCDISLLDTRTAEIQEQITNLYESN